eukprot:SAG22_NODE_20_length_32168_cov_40.859241_15_plen_254_part_00
MEQAEDTNHRDAARAGSLGAPTRCKRGSSEQCHESDSSHESDDVVDSDDVVVQLRPALMACAGLPGFAVRRCCVWPGGGAAAAQAGVARMFRGPMQPLLATKNPENVIIFKHATRNHPHTAVTHANGILPFECNHGVPHRSRTEQLHTIRAAVLQSQLNCRKMVVFARKFSRLSQLFAAEQLLWRIKSVTYAMRAYPRTHGALHDAVPTSTTYHPLCMHTNVLNALLVRKCSTFWQKQPFFCSSADFAERLRE